MSVGSEVIPCREKSVSPVSPPEGYLGGVVGDSEAKWGYESPAPPQGILCGGHGRDSDFPDGCHKSCHL